MLERVNDEKNGDKEDISTSVQELVALLKTLKDLEKQEVEYQSSCEVQYSGLQAEITALEQDIADETSGTNLVERVDRSISDSEEKLYLAKMELASVLREVVSLKRKIDSFPVQSELIQYERRFSDLNALIQEKHRQTRNCYATYNALLEIKELMLKEISLLNSINSQFRDAIASPAGQMKLIDSMEGILKGTQQRLRKAELDIQKEQKSCDAIKERYAAAVSKQRQFHSLLKTFQDKDTDYGELRHSSL
uniref:CCDC93 coiled-coil domain-containing protein n=1 Tax=Kalanchoe fedtschenkoi TaxID=63787 RepID=A0A7N0V3C1_KALFE